MCHDDFYFLNNFSDVGNGTLAIKYGNQVFSVTSTATLYYCVINDIKAFNGPRKWEMEYIDAS